MLDIISLPLALFRFFVLAVIAAYGLRAIGVRPVRLVGLISHPRIAIIYRALLNPRYFTALFFLLIIGEPAYRSWYQYVIWANDPAAKFLLPPHQPWTYFAGYVGMHFWAWRLVGLVFAGAIFLLADRFVVRPSEGFRMNRNEAALVAFGVAFAGWPYLLVYLIALLVFYFFLLLFLTAWQRAASREKRPGGTMAMVPEQSEDELRRGPSDAASEPPRFPVALPATLALLVIPFAPWVIDALGLTVLRVTNLSV